MTAKELFEAAVAKVESKSIREWATSAHNKPILLQIAAKATASKESEPAKVLRFSTWLVCEAMGL